MADYYVTFADTISGISTAEKKWARKVLAADPDEVGGLLEKKEFFPEYWPSFEWEITKDQLHLWAEETFEDECLVEFIQAFLRKFRPKHSFIVTTAFSCNKMRAGAFGGGWLVINKDRVFAGNTRDTAMAHLGALETGVTYSDKVALARNVYEHVYKCTESFEEQKIGVDLAYLLGAILKDTTVEWPAGAPIIPILQGCFPDLSVLGKYIISPEWET